MEDAGPKALGFVGWLRAHEAVVERKAEGILKVAHHGIGVACASDYLYDVQAVVEIRV